MHIYLTNHSTVVKTADLAAELPAYQHYANLVCSAWGLRSVTLSMASPPANSWQIVVLDDADQAGALGYHDFQPGGQPISSPWRTSSPR